MMDCQVVKCDSLSDGVIRDGGEINLSLCVDCAQPYLDTFGDAEWTPYAGGQPLKPDIEDSEWQMERSECYFCDSKPADNAVVVEKEDVHHATNTLACDDCRDHPRVIR